MTKRWWESKTIISGLITIAASALGAGGIVIDQDVQDQMTELILMGITAVSGAVAVYGRIKADSAIAKK